MPTLEINKWFHDAFGVDPGEFVDRLKAEMDAASAPKPEKKQHATKGSTGFKKKISGFEGPPVPLLGGRLTAKFTSVIEVMGTVETIVPDAAETTNLSVGAFDDQGFSQSVAHTWNDTEGVAVFGWHSVFTEVELSGAVRFEKGLSVGVSGSGKLGCGVALKFEAILVKIGEDSKVEGFKFSGGADIPYFPFTPLGMDLGPLVKVSDVKIQPTVSVAIEPNWPLIWATVAKDVAADGALGAAGEKGSEAAISSAGADLAIASGFLLIAAASVAASIGTINDLGDAAATPGQCRTQTKALLAGYKLGVLGDDPPTLSVMTVGYFEGMRARNEALRKLHARFPDITDDQVNQVFETVVDRLVDQARPEIEARVKQAVWEQFASTHQDGWLKSYEFARWTAWNGIFGREPRGEALYTKYAGS